MADKLIQLVEMEIGLHQRTLQNISKTKITWEEYKEDTKNLPIPSEKQIQIFADEIKNSSLLGRCAEKDWKVIPFLSSRPLMGDDFSEEDIRKTGYLTYVILDEKGNLVHSQGSGMVADMLPKELLENAARIEIPEFKGAKIRTNMPSFAEGRGIEESLRKILL